ncbi:hypothetical protein PRIPAC_70380, partial [Pristionchus pacificus]
FAAAYSGSTGRNESTLVLQIIKKVAPHRAIFLERRSLRSTGTKLRKSIFPHPSQSRVITHSLLPFVE